MVLPSPSRRLDPEDRAAALRRLDGLTAIGARASGALPPEPVPGGWVPGPAADDPDDPGEVDEGEAEDEPVGAAAPESRPRPPGGVLAAAGQAVGERLPAALHGGRTDPERSGLVALVVLALVAALLAGWFVLRSRPVELAAPAPETVVETAAPAAGESAAPAPPGGAPAGEVVVAVAGHVVRPGVVRLPAGSRVDDAVRAAGGVAPGADPGLLNLARVLVDGEQVLVGVEPPPDAAAPPAAGTGAATGAAPPPGAPAGAAGGLLDINRATAADFEDLPGVGPVLAERIVAHRESIGRFAGVDQLREVSGIGEGRYAAIEDLITVS